MYNSLSLFLLSLNIFHHASDSSLFISLSLFLSQYILSRFRFLPLYPSLSFSLNISYHASYPSSFLSSPSLSFSLFLSHHASDSPLFIPPLSLFLSIYFITLQIPPLFLPPSLSLNIYEYVYIYKASDFLIILSVVLRHIGKSVSNYFSQQDDFWSCLLGLENIVTAPL